MRIYIAHPYTGDEERNRERALKAEELLRQATPNVGFLTRLAGCRDDLRGCHTLKCTCQQKLDTKIPKIVMET